MRRDRLRRSPQPASDAAVSEVVGFLLVFAVVSFLVVMAMFGFSTLRADRVEDAAWDEADAVGQRLAAVVTQVAAWAAEHDPDLDGDHSLTREVELPYELAGHSFQVRLESTGVVVSVPNLGIESTTEVYLPPGSPGVCASNPTLNGGAVSVSYNNSVSCGGATLQMVYP